jgi:hypothetical protein
MQKIKESDFITVQFDELTKCFESDSFDVLWDMYQMGSLTKICFLQEGFYEDFPCDYVWQCVWSLSRTFL